MECRTERSVPIGEWVVLLFKGRGVSKVTVAAHTYVARARRANCTRTHLPDLLSVRFDGGERSGCNGPGRGFVDLVVVGNVLRRGGISRDVSLDLTIVGGIEIVGSSHLWVATEEMS